MVMMLKLLPVTALVLGLSGGVALADHGRGGDHRAASVEHRAAPAHTVVHGGGNVVVRDHRDFHGGYERGYRGYDHGYRGGYGGRVVVNNGPRYYGGGGYRRPIYVGRPVIRERYYNHYRRPALIVESYGPREGYFWTGGAWSWDGGEWIWAPGHYEPDPAYY
jgi:hypothetical protein